MAKNYVIDGEDTNTASTTILELRSTTAIRPKVFDFLLSSDASPADNAADYALQRTTTAGTSTAVTPQLLDPGDPAATATAGKAHSGEPTYTANALMLHVACNQRATFRWVAVPGREIVLPAAANGLGLQVLTNNTSAVNVGSTIYYEE